MKDAFELFDALFSPLGAWVVVTFLMGVAMQLIGLLSALSVLARRTADMVRTTRLRRRARLAADADGEGELAVVSPPGQ